MNSINRIFEENAVIDFEDFHIVNDKFPISDSHLIAITKNNSPSLIKDKIEILPLLVAKVEHYYNEKCLFFEKGNVSFCTSFNGPFLTHIHFMRSSLLCKDTITNLKEEADADHFKLEKIIDKSKEYLIFGENKNTYFTDSSLINKKQFIRNYLQNKKI